MSKSIVVPKFATESEEADWWFDHREEHDEIMGKAMEEGRTISVRDFLTQHGLTLDKQPVYLNAADADLARRQAAARGVDTESYLENLLHEAVNAAG